MYFPLPLKNSHKQGHFNLQHSFIRVDEPSRKVIVTPKCLGGMDGEQAGEVEKFKPQEQFTNLPASSLLAAVDSLRCKLLAESSRSRQPDVFDSLSKMEDLIKTQFEQQKEDLMASQRQMIEWTREVKSIAQNGLTYCTDRFDKERYEQLQQLAAAMVSSQTTLTTAEALVALEADKWYDTPKIDVRGVIFQEDKILLVKEMEDNRWSLPGGWVDVNQSPSKAIIKEIQEEAGYNAKPVKLCAVYDKHNQQHGHPPQLPHAFKMFFLCEINSECQRSDLETSEVAFFSEEELPPLSLNRVTTSQIRRMFEFLQNPDMLTDFD